jgi:hypothetical protein
VHMVRAGILTWLFASVPLSLLMGRMFRVMPVEPCRAAQGEPLLRRAASGH